MKLYTSLNKEAKLYGVNLYGFAIGGISFVILWLMFSAMFGIVGGSFGFYYGSVLSKMWHKGIMQKYIYVKLPVKLKISSYKRYFC